MARWYDFNVTYPASPQPELAVHIRMTPGRWNMIEYDSHTGKEVIEDLRGRFAAKGIKLPCDVDFKDLSFQRKGRWR